MGRTEFDQEAVQSFLENRKIATLEELKKALGSSSTMTVFRKLKPLGYRTSYSHRGKYYTLEGTPRFDQQGLWEYDSVWFSQHGNLLSTSQWFVEELPSASFNSSSVAIFRFCKKDCTASWSNSILPIRYSSS